MPQPLQFATQKVLQIVTIFVVSWQNWAQKKTAIKYRSLTLYVLIILFFTIAFLQPRQLLHYL